MPCNDRNMPLSNHIFYGISFESMMSSLISVRIIFEQIPVTWTVIYTLCIPFGWSVMTSGATYTDAHGSHSHSWTHAHRGESLQQIFMIRVHFSFFTLPLTVIFVCQTDNRNENNRQSALFGIQSDNICVHFVISIGVSQKNGVGVISFDIWKAISCFAEPTDSYISISVQDSR